MLRNRALPQTIQIYLPQGDPAGAVVLAPSFFELPTQFV